MILLGPNITQHLLEHPLLLKQKTRNGEGKEREVRSLERDLGFWFLLLLSMGLDLPRCYLNKNWEEWRTEE